MNKRVRNNENSHIFDETESAGQTRSLSTSTSQSIATASDLYPSYYMTTSSIHSREMRVTGTDGEGSIIDRIRNSAFRMIGTVRNARTGSVVGYIERVSENQNAIYPNSANTPDCHEVHSRTLSQSSKSASNISVIETEA